MIIHHYNDSETPQQPKKTSNPETLTDVTTGGGPSGNTDATYSVIPGDGVENCDVTTRVEIDYTQGWIKYFY